MPLSTSLRGSAGASSARRSRSPILLSFLLWLALASLGGCGNRGELYLPPDEALEREVRDIDERLPAFVPEVDVTTPADTVNSRTPPPVNEIESSAPSGGGKTATGNGSPGDGEDESESESEDDDPPRRRSDAERDPSEGAE